MQVLKDYDDGLPSRRGERAGQGRIFGGSNTGMDEDGFAQVEPVVGGQVAEPVWPDTTFQEIIDIGFRDKKISDLGHPVLKRLRGEI